MGLCLSIKIKWFGTASILLECDGTQILIDPFIPLNKKIFQPSIKEFAEIEHILITHGHLDHAGNIPAILNQSRKKNLVYCTGKVRENFISKGIPEEHLSEISPGTILNIGSFQIKVLKGAHIVFDKAMFIRAFLRLCIPANFKRLQHILKENKQYGEFGETIAFDIQSQGKRILLLGSLNLDDNTDYPKGADLLILPFQGRTDINTYALPFIDRLVPKKILLDHFDNSFPPISSTVNSRTFESAMRSKYPETEVIRLVAGEFMVISD